jgi:hypothetical protein
MCCQWVVHTFVHILKKTEILLAYININLINVTKKTITNNFINKSEWSSQLPLWPEIVRILATLSTYLNAFPTKMPTCINCLTFFRNDWTSQPALYDLSNIFFETIERPSRHCTICRTFSFELIERPSRHCTICRTFFSNRLNVPDGIVRFVEHFLSNWLNVPDGTELFVEHFLSNRSNVPAGTVVRHATHSL